MATPSDRLHLDHLGATEASLQVAGIGSRSFAFLIDWHIRVLLALAWVAAWSLASRLVFGDWGAIFSEDWLTAVALVPPALLYFGYHPVLETVMRGRSPGKRTAGVRVVTTAGATPGVGALLIRNVFRLLDSLPTFYLVGLAATALTKRYVRIGDLAAGTVLVVEDPVRPDAFAQGYASADGDLLVAELANDIVSRWRSLDRRVRAGLARDLLVSQGAAVPDVDPRRGDEPLLDAVAALGSRRSAAP